MLPIRLWYMRELCMVNGFERLCFIKASPYTWNQQLREVKPLESLLQ